jgi:membrane associated rhomboid family serine protease
MSSSAYQQKTDNNQYVIEPGASQPKLLAPWEAPDAFPEKPSGYEYGYMKGKRIIGFNNWGELVIRVREDTNGRIRLVWTPDQPRMVPPEEVPSLYDIVKQRNMRRYTKLRNWSLISTFLWLFIGLTSPSRSQLFPILLINVLAIGIIPLLQSIWELRKLRNFTPENMAQGIITARYAAWTRNQKAFFTKGMSISIVLLALVQFSTSVVSIFTSKPSPVEAAGLVKDAVWHGELWRLLTGPLLHGNFIHLYFNVLALFVLGSVVEALAGWALSAVILLLSILGGSLFSLLLLPATSVGISGGLMGLIGFLTILGFFHRQHLPPGFLRSMLVSIALIAALGIVAFSYIDNAAHLGGLVVGTILGLIFTRRRDPIFPLPTNGVLHFAGGMSALLLLIAIVTTLMLMLR